MHEDYCRPLLFSMTFLRTYRQEIGIALLALFAHVLCFLVVAYTHPDTIRDIIHADDAYYEIATNLIAGNGFSSATTSPYAPNALRTPGYIYPLAGLLWAGGDVAVVLMQLLIASLIPVLGMHIARHITASMRIGLVTGIILALDPTLALLSFRFYTDTLFVFLFLAWMLLAFRYLKDPRWNMLAISAILLGFAILTRPTAQYIPFLFVPFILWRFGTTKWGQGAVHVLTLLAIVGAILTPWIMRNYHEFNAPGLSAQRHYVIYTNFAPAVLSIARDTDFAIEVSTFSTYAERAGSVITPRNGDTYTMKAVEIILANPAASAFVAGRSLFTFFTNDGMFTLLSAFGQSPYAFLWLLIPTRLVWVAITLAAFLGALVYLLRERSSLAILLILLVAYFALTSVIAAFGTNPRYRLPIDPILLALAAVGSKYLLERARYLRSRRAPTIG
jgi:hypothetical protein